MDDEDGAVATWKAVLELGETPSTYPVWRNLAAAYVRAGELGPAMRAYREADRRAPAADKAEIANRLGWLAKETGDTGHGEEVLRAGARRRPAHPVHLRSSSRPRRSSRSRSMLTAEGAGPAAGPVARQGGRRRPGSTGGCGP